MTKFWFVLAAAFGFLSVALGALGAHSLKSILDEYGRSIFEKAVLYQMFHAMALFAVGLVQLTVKSASLLTAGCLFSVGIFLFSGSLYLLAITGMRWLGAITPFGGISFLLGWIWFGYGILRAKV
jgi:uncharacterized membrane protein YgdD (TMEM256/DUF423 family)